MSKTMRFRFWLEMVLGILTGILFVITFLWNDWIEIMFHIDPDGGNGAVEWLIVAVLLALTIVLFVLARFEWRKTQASVA